MNDSAPASLDGAIQQLAALYRSGEKEACTRALQGLRSRYRLEPAAFDAGAIRTLKEIAQGLEGEPDLRLRLKSIFGFEAFRPACWGARPW